MNKVQHGSQLVDQAGATMAEIALRVGRVTGIMAASAGPAARVAAARPAPARLAVKAPVKPVQAKRAAKAQVSAGSEAWEEF